MIEQGATRESRADWARKANTPWRGENAMRVQKPTRRAQQPKRDMSLLELDCGITETEFDAWHAEQRARVRARYGL